MTTLLELSAQIKKVIEIFNRHPELYQQEGIARISPTQRQLEEFTPLLRYRTIDELLISDAAQTDSFGYLMMGALKKGLKEAVIFEVSPEAILALTTGLFSEEDIDKITAFLYFQEQLATSDNINDILTAQIIHDFLHIAVNIQSQSAFNKMDAENCGRMFGVNLANLLRIDPRVGLALNGVVRELITGPQFSKPFLFDERMRACLERRQIHLSDMTAEMNAQVDLQSSSILDASNMLMMKPLDNILPEKKKKKIKKPQRRHSEAEIKVACSLDQIAKLKSVITTLQLEQVGLSTLLYGGEPSSEPGVTSPLLSPRSPRVIPSPRELIHAGPGARLLQRSQPIEIVSPREENSQHRNRSTSYSPRSTPLSEQTSPRFPPPVFRNNTNG